jgi:hypothetical protein
VCLASWRRDRASQITAQQRFRRQLFAKPASLDCLFLLLIRNFAQDRFRRTTGCCTGRLRFSPIKFFLTRNPLPTGDRLDRTRLWASSLPVISPCVQLAALCIQGEQPTLGASKMMVYRLHLRSLINRGFGLI